MQRQENHAGKTFSVASGSAAVLIAGSGAMICARLAQGAASSIPMPSWLALLMELGTYAALLALFGAPRSALTYAVGVIALCAIRWAITLASGGIQALHEGGGAWQHAKTMQGMAAPRMAALVFSAVAFFPLRDLLPGGPSSRPAGASQKKNAEQSDVMLLFGDQAGTEVSPDETAEAADDSQSPGVEQAPIEGSLSLPLRVALQNVASFSAAADSGEVEIEVPLALIVPHLKEGRIVVAARDLAPHFPPGVNVGQETVELPLREVVLALPADVLRLPHASPPAWARVEGLDQEVLFVAA